MIITAKLANQLATEKEQEEIEHIFDDVFSSITSKSRSGNKSCIITNKELNILFDRYTEKNTYHVPVGSKKYMKNGSTEQCDVTYDHFIIFTKKAFESLGYEIIFANSECKLTW